MRQRLHLVIKKLGRTLEGTSNIETFKNKYNWDGIKCSSKTEDWEKFEINYPKIVINVLYEKKWKYAQQLFENAS